jgi:hypothetical protein
MFSLTAGPGIQRKGLIILRMIAKNRLISAPKQKFSLISGRREPPPPRAGSRPSILALRRRGKSYASVAVVGSIMRRISVTLLAGKPLRRACS